MIFRLCDNIEIFNFYTEEEEGITLNFQIIIPNWLRFLRDPPHGLDARSFLLLLCLYSIFFSYTLTSILAQSELWGLREVLIVGRALLGRRGTV